MELSLFQSGKIANGFVVSERSKVVRDLVLIWKRHVFELSVRPPDLFCFVGGRIDNANVQIHRQGPGQLWLEEC